MNNILIDNLKVVLFVFLVVVLIIPIIIKIAHHVNALDIPNERKVHKFPMPRLGGLAIFIGFLVGYMVFCKPTVQMNSILIGSFIIIMYGIIDDIKTLPAKIELLGQLLAASTIVFYGQILLNDITIFGTNFEFGIFAYPITIFFILGCTNVIRLIDGLDGLSSGISSIFYLTVGIISFFQGSVQTLEITLAFIMLGAT